MPITIKQNSITFQDENGNSNNSSAFLLGSTAALEQRLNTIETETIAPAHSTASKPYVVGEYVTYNDNLYKCKTAHISTSWMAANWTKVSMTADYTSELTDLKSALLSTVSYSDMPVILQNKTTSDKISISSIDGSNAYITGNNFVNLPNITVGSSVFNPKNLCIPFRCCIDWDISQDFAQSQSAWLIYVCFKDGTKRYLFHDANRDSKVLLGTIENPIVEFYVRSSYVTSGGLSNIRVTQNYGDAYTSYYGKTVSLPVSNESLYDGINYVWTDGNDITLLEIKNDGRIVNIENDIINVRSEISEINDNFKEETISTTINVTNGISIYKDIDYNFKAGQRVSLSLSGDVGIINDLTSAFFIDQTNTPVVYLPYTKYNIPVEYTFPNDATKIRCFIGATRAIGNGTVTFSITIIPINTRLSNSENRTTILEDKVNPINEEFTKFNLPDYYFANNYIQNKIARINTLAKDAVGNGDAFVFITDEHWAQNAKKSPNLLHYISNHCHIKNIISGGDTAAGGSDDFCRLLLESWGGTVHHVSGNHEYDNNRSNSELYYMMDMQNNDEIGNPQERYYYYDNVQAKIRYIILNSDGSSGYSSDQLTWFLSALNVDLGWGIIIFVHWMYMVSWTTNTISLGSSAPQGFVDAINNYAGNGEIIAVFQGHVHRDRITYTKTNGTPVIITTCDKYVATESDIDVTRELGTITEQAFDVVVVNRLTKTINIVRIGGLAHDGIGNEPGDEVEERSVTWN